MTLMRSVLMLFLLFSVSVNAQTVSGPKLEIKSLIEFGTLKQGEKQHMEVLYQNTGTSNLVVSNVVSSSSFIKVTNEGSEIKPGAYGKILIDINYWYFYNETYPPSGDQQVNKTIMIMTNEEENSSHAIKIKGAMAEPTVINK